MVVPPLPPLLQAGIVLPRAALRVPGFLCPWSGFVQRDVKRGGRGPGLEKGGSLAGTHAVALGN